MFLNNLSSKFTQEFSLAVNLFVHEFLKQSIIIVQGVLFVFALFNLQGTEPLSALAVSLHILAHLSEFVKYFFQVFQNFLMHFQAILKL